MKPILAAFVCVLTASAGRAQAPVPTEFPADAASVPAEGLRGRLVDQVLVAKMADGSSWRFEFKSSGYLFVNTSKGYADSGKWRTEDGRLCVEMTRTGAVCSEMRSSGEVLYLKRVSNGEVTALSAP